MLCGNSTVSAINDCGPFTARRIPFLDSIGQRRPRFLGVRDCMAHVDNNREVAVIDENRLVACCIWVRFVAKQFHPKIRCARAEG